MTVAKAEHLKARRLLLKHLDIHPGHRSGNDLDPAEVGIVGSSGHVSAGTSYHLGRDDLKMSRQPYSVVESTRDRRGLDNHASAMDIGQFKVTVKGKSYDLRHFSRWLVGLCRKDDPDTKDIREIIYTTDGKTVRRWDRLGKRSGGDDTHLWHTHISEFRDASGTRMVTIMQRYLTHIGLIAGGDKEDDMGPSEEVVQKIVHGKLTEDNALYYWLRGIVNGTIPRSGPGGKLDWSKMEGAPWPGLKQIGERIAALEAKQTVDVDALADRLAPLLEAAAEKAVREAMAELGNRT